MLRFPLRLTADLAKVRIARIGPGDSAAPAVLLVSPVEQAHSSSFESSKFPAEAKAGTELLSFVRDSAAPVIWIGGPDPLLHPEIAQLTRCINGHGQHVFLETDGALLRRRIHEFRPVSRLFLTVQVIDVIGFESGVCFELALPETMLGLDGKEMVRAAFDGFFQTLDPILLLQGHGRWSNGNFFSYSGE